MHKHVTRDEKIVAQLDRTNINISTREVFQHQKNSLRQKRASKNPVLIPTEKYFHSFFFSFHGERWLGYEEKQPRE
jgi:hypothetical protein